MKTDTLIVGAGLSGLALARALQAEGRDVAVLEARARIGGRILSPDGFDMGPAWFWPGQPRIARLIAELGLTKFDQFATGDLYFEDENGRVERGQGFASMAGSWRLKGGLGNLTQTLANQLQPNTIRLSCEVSTLELTDTGIVATCQTGKVIRAHNVVLALPPRIAAKISFTPALPTSTIDAMQGVATWMAGQAKAVAIYETPFWRDAGLSGDAMSRRGPMVEIHDASPQSGGPYALFGFIGVPVAARQDKTALQSAIADQFIRIFGDQAHNPASLQIMDWAFDPYTATTADHTPLSVHPHYGLPRAMQNLWNGQLLLSGTETAEAFGGYLEGALEAAENAQHRLPHDRS